MIRTLFKDLGRAIAAKGAIAAPMANERRGLSLSVLDRRRNSWTMACRTEPLPFHYEEYCAILRG